MSSSSILNLYYTSELLSESMAYLPVITLKSMYIRQTYEWNAFRLPHISIFSFHQEKIFRTSVFSGARLLKAVCSLPIQKQDVGWDVVCVFLLDYRKKSPSLNIKCCFGFTLR